MIAGVGVGMVLAVLLLIKRFTELTQVVLEVKDPSTMIYRIRGPLFFGTIEKAFDRNRSSYDKINKLIIDMSEVPFIDMTGLVGVKSLLTAMANPKREVHIVCNVADVTQKIQKKIKNLVIKPYVFFHDNLP